jgi:transposase-like protein
MVVNNSLEKLFFNQRYIIMLIDKKCPRCDSDALYKFGKTKNGKQRYKCQLCNRQFVLGKTRLEVKNRPDCPSCGKPMHVYMRSDYFIRFRCSDYPNCKTFHKLTKAVPLVHELLKS